MGTHIGTLQSDVGSVEDSLEWLVATQNSQTTQVNTLKEELDRAEGNIDALETQHSTTIG